MITILTDPGVGGTFLTWSLHFLAGHTTIYSTKTKSFVDLIQNPLTSINAHNFIPNQPLNIDMFDNYLGQLTTTESTNFHTLYFHNFNDCNRLNTGTTSSAIDSIISPSKKIIYLSLDKKNVLYQCNYKARVLLKKTYQTFEEQHNDFIVQYFLKDKQLWNKLGLDKPWDYREFLALNTRPFDIIKMSDTNQFKFDHYYIDSFDLYHYFDLVIDDLFDYLEITIDNTKKHNWLTIYQEWKKLHCNRVQFVYYFDLIIDYIFNGKYFDLTRLNLDIMQEAAIQHYIIYNHHLNFKTWQLEKIINTQQLHDLLEPNIHTLN
jgi:hypothetical protein